MPDRVKIPKQALLTASLAIVHTCHSQRPLTVKNIHVNNTSNVAVAVRIALSGPSTPASVATSLVWDHDLEGNDFLEFGEGTIIPAGYSLQASAGTTDVIVLTLSGEEEQ